MLLSSTTTLEGIKACVPSVLGKIRLSLFSFDEDLPGWDVRTDDEVLEKFQSHSN